MKKILSVIFSILIVSGLVYAASNLARRYPSDTPMEVLTPDSISNTAYGISWSTVTDVAPSQKALYDKIETLGGGHDAVTLDVNADTILELTGQEVGLDDQDANKVFSGPTTGEADTPAFRSLVAGDIPDLSGTYLTAESDPLSATKALDNLDSVSINTSLVSDTDSTDNLGSSSIYWANAYLDKIYLDSDSTIEASDVDAWNALVTFPGFTDLATDYGFTDNSSNWDTAYGWGDWSGEGFISDITGESIFDLSDFPADPGADKYLMWDDNPGQLVWADAGVGSGATTALDNLASVAINTSLLSDAADTDSLGDTTHEWANLYIGDAGKIYLGLGQDASINRSAANTMTLTASSGVTTSAGLTVTGTLNGAAINGTIITGDQLISDAASDTAATCGLIDFRKSRDGDPTDSVSDNDYLGELRFRGYHTAGYHEGAIIRAVVNGTPGDGDMPTELIFATSADASATPTTRLTIDATGLATFANGITGNLTGNVTGDVSGNAGTATTATTAKAGDSATAFFSSGTIEHEYGGLEADVSAYAGLVKIASGTTSAVTLGIADTNVAPINAADVADNDYAKFTATGLEGKSYSEVLSDIGAEAADANIIKAAEIDTSAEIATIVTDETGTAGNLVFSNSPTFDDDIQLGKNGATGILKLYSEQGGTDYTASLYPNTAMTSAASFYLPVDEPAATSFINMTTGGVMGFVASSTIPTTSSNLSAFAATTSAQLYGVLNNETGSGSGTPLAVFNVNPTLTGATMAGNLTLGEGVDPASNGIVMDAAMSADERYSGVTIPGTAGATLAFGDLCYLDVTATEWLLADADAAATAGDVPLGICVDASTDGNATSMLLIGTVRSAAFPASIALGAPVYVSTTAGDIQAAQPTGTDDIVRRVGWAMTSEPNTIYFNPSNDYVTHT